MHKDYSPFTPGIPVPKELFVGRKREIDKLKSKVTQAARGRLQIAFLAGERGIGKSSLAAFTKYLAEKDEKALGIHTFLGGVNSLEEMVRKVFERLLQDSSDRLWYDKIKSLFGNYIKQVGLFGVNLEFDAPKKDLKHLVNNFAPALENILKKLEDDRRVIFLILDDINGLANSPEFADWLKSLVDEIATRYDKFPLCILIVGYEERRHQLVKLQPSLSRVFDLFEIEPLNKSEIVKFFQTAFSQVSVKYDKEALELMADYTGGLPVLAHEIGDAVYNLDEDNNIETMDAAKGIKVAADIVGKKHLKPNVINALQKSGRYNAILKKIGEDPFLFEFNRGEVRSKLNEKEKRVFDNFLRKMREMGVIVADQDKGRGYYRFANTLHYLYFKMSNKGYMILSEILQQKKQK